MNREGLDNLRAKLDQNSKEKYPLCGILVFSVALHYLYCPKVLEKRASGPNGPKSTKKRSKHVETDY